MTGGTVASMREEVLEGLSRPRKELQPKYFYDERGSRLFEEITRLPEYYLTRVERSLLARWVPEWTRELRPASLVELGAGSASKSRLILDAMVAAGCGETFVPVDVSGAFLRETADELRRDYPGLHIAPEVLDITSSFDLATSFPRPALFALLGSTLGNFYPDQARALLARIREHMTADDVLLLGLDLRPGPKKSVEVLEAAYNDARGVTAEFNRNILNVLNRSLGMNFDPEAFEHRARYNRQEGRIEVALAATSDQEVRTPGGEPLRIRAGEEIRTEVSCKYDRSTAESLLESAGLEIRRWVSDEDERFALVLSAPSHPAGP